MINIISIQRAGGFGTIQYVDDGAVKVNRFPATMSDQQAIELVAPTAKKAKTIPVSPLVIPQSAPVATAPPEPDKVTEPTTEELRAQARKLGIKSAHNMKRETLINKINAAMGE